VPPKKHIIIIGVLCVIALGLGYVYGKWRQGSGQENAGNVEAKEETAAKEPEFLKEGLVAYYPFNGNAKDESSNSNDFTVKGATLTKDRHGISDRAYAFDGVNAYMEAPNHPSLQLTQFTVSVWMHPISARHSPILLKDTHHSLENYGLWFGGGLIPSHLPNDGRLRVGIFLKGRNQYNLPSKSPVVLDSYIMVTMTAVTMATNKTRMKLFIDGKLDNEREVNDVPGIDQLPLYLGYDGGYPGGGGYAKFHGTLDDIRIYNRALSEAEVKELYVFEKAN